SQTRTSALCETLVLVAVIAAAVVIIITVMAMNIAVAIFGGGHRDRRVRQLLRNALLLVSE
ncbi:MAG: hypothetical protein WA231_00400, partial [Methylocella sp.]